MFGRWGSDFSDGTKPWAWTGSPEILEQYMAARQPVKYGQCWNFCGLTTTCKLNVTYMHHIPSRHTSSERCMDVRMASKRRRSSVFWTSCANWVSPLTVDDQSTKILDYSIVRIS